ncbi:hypothetical protein ACLOJK_037410 [Asimina triloba]
MIPSSIVAQLWEELEASRAEVARLQSMLRGDSVRSSAVAEYLRSTAYRRRMEFEQAHLSQSGYVRAISDVATLNPEVVGGSLHVVILCASRQGRSYSGDQARVVPAGVLKEMCCLRMMGCRLCWVAYGGWTHLRLALGSPMLVDSQCWIEGRLWRLDSLVLSTGVAYVGGFSVLNRGSPMATGPAYS